MKFKVKLSKATMLKVAGIALTIAGSMIDGAERKIEIRNAVDDYMKENTVTLTERVSGM